MYLVLVYIDLYIIRGEKSGNALVCCGLEEDNYVVTNFEVSKELVPMKKENQRKIS